MNLFELFVKIGVDDQASGKLKDLGGKLGNGLKTAAKIGTAAVAAASTAVVAFGASSVKAGMEFDTAMSQVAATMGKTVDEVTELRDFAQEMGRTTVFSATQSAEALNYMALAGYDAEQAMSALPTVLNLAAAGSIDLAYASDMVTDAQSALGLTMEESATMVDQMAKTASKSNTSVAQLGEAILTVGGTASYMAGGTEQINKVLGVLADNGIKGAEAGTHLRNMLLSLSSPTDDAKMVMEQLGLQIFDAEGNMRDFAEIFPELNDAMSSLTDQEKLDKFSLLFNTRDIAAATALLNTSTERWEELGDAIVDSKGAAEAMAATQLDNLAGDITLFKSALEGAQIAISDQLTPTLREFVQFGSEGISQLTEGFKEGGLTGAMDAFGSLLSEGVAKIAESLPSIVKAGSSLVEALVDGISQNADLISTSAVDTASTLIESFLEMLPEIVALGLDLIVSLAEGIADSLPELVPTVIEVIKEIVDTLTDPTNLKKLLSAALEIIKELAYGLMDAIPELVDAVIEIIIGLQSFLTDPENLAKIITAAIEIILALATGLINAIPKILTAGGKVIKSLIDNFKETDWAQVGKDVVNGIWDGLKRMWGSLKSWFKNAWNDLVGGVKDLLGIHSPSRVFADIGKNMALGVGDGWDAQFGKIKNDIDKSLVFDDASVRIGASVKNGSSFNYGFGGGVSVVQNIYSEAKTAADLMQEALYLQERAVLIGV